MRNVPKKIYLQIDADGETPEDFKGLEVSWCVDKIYPNDIEYKLSNEPEERKFSLKEALELWECGYDNGWIDGTEADTHMGDHNDDTFNMLKKRQYFKEKFNILIN